MHQRYELNLIEICALLACGSSVIQSQKVWRSICRRLKIVWGSWTDIDMKEDIATAKITSFTFSAIPEQPIISNN